MKHVTLLFLSLSACTSILPTAPVERALVNDVRMIVRSQETSEWTVDRVAVDLIAPAVAWSACQVPADARASTLAWLDEAIGSEEQRLGGRGLPHAELWRRADKDKGALDDLIELQRIRLAIGDLHQRADADCPYWLEADPEFIGMQGNADRFIMLLESRGGASLAIRGSTVAVGGGGAGRVLFGGGVDDGLTIAAGIEIGGIGQFDDAGDVTAVIGGALPIVARFVDAGTVFDLEVAPVTVLDGEAWPPGVRFAVSYGLVTPRVSGSFSPSAVLWLGYEYHPARGDGEPFHLIGLGTRVGVDFDP